MNNDLFDHDAPKKPTNVSVNRDLLARARALNLNLSQLLEERLTSALREARRREWLAENREALENYNSRIERSGSFGDTVRRF